MGALHSEKCEVVRVETVFYGAEIKVFSTDEVDGNEDS